MRWIQLIVFTLLVNGFFTLFGLRFMDLIQVLAVGKQSTLQDDVDVLLGKPAKGFFNRESVEIEQLLKTTGREGRFTVIKRISVLLFAVGAVISLLSAFHRCRLPETFKRRTGNGHFRSDHLLSSQWGPAESR